LAEQSPLFEGGAWKSIDPEIVVLDRCFRQDGLWPSILNRLRLTRSSEYALPADVYGALLSLKAPRSNFFKVPLSDRSYPVICGRKSTAKRIGDSALGAVPGKSVYRFATDVDLRREPNTTPLSELFKDGTCQLEHELQLKETCPVLFTKNGLAHRVDDGAPVNVVNGSRGTLCKIIGDDELIVDLLDGRGTVRVVRVRCEVEVGGEVIATRTQFPLILAYAFHIHKVQGIELEGKGSILMHKTEMFARHMAYVALSRFRDPSLVKLYMPPDVIQSLCICFWTDFKCRGLY
jgi:hypothetical protein